MSCCQAICTKACIYELTVDFLEYGGKIGMHSEIVPYTNHLAHSKFQVYIDFHSRDQEWTHASTHYESQSIYIPPAKRIDTRSSDSHSSGGHSDHRERRPRGHNERDLRRERQRRHGQRGGYGGASTSGRADGRYSRTHNREPDYVRNPSKWTKYDLKEDGSQVLRGMSQDQVNKYAAFQFLDEIKKRKSSSSLTTQQSD